jgi:hypothetical protein
LDYLGELPPNGNIAFFPLMLFLFKQILDILSLNIETAHIGGNIPIGF